LKSLINLKFIIIFHKEARMKRNILDQKGRGLIGLLFWAALAVLLAWAAWQLYLHPESFNPKAPAHNAYEDAPITGR
jgi:hypothetical protein